jgi:uracil phosphoribosyltransferase
VHVVNHPLVGLMLTEARDKGTPPRRFRAMLGQIGMLLAYEATRDLATEAVDVNTPLEVMRGTKLKHRITVVPILRAGLGLAQGVQHLLPDAMTGHLGMFRDEQALSPVSYYEKLPTQIAGTTVLLCDPMLATGGSAVAAIGLLRSRGCKDVRLLCLVAAPEGIAKVTATHPDLPIYVAAVDRELDDRGYILPGLGDAGDRLFGTSADD